MPWAVASAVIGAGASIYAGSQQAGAAKKSAKLQQQQYQQTRADEMPYMDAGKKALADIQNGIAPGGDLVRPFTIDDYHRSPGYNFQMQEGDNAILNNASALGGVRGGNTLRALRQFGQGVANQDFEQSYQDFVANQGRKFGMLDTLAAGGENAASQTGTFGANAATNAGNNLTGAANANAAGAVGAADAIGGGINNYLQYQYLNANRQPDNPYLPAAWI